MPGKKYDWQIVAKGLGGLTNGSIWSFTTAAVPNSPSTPTPVSGATGVSTTAPVRWAATTNATQYDVAFGATNPPAIVLSNQAATTYQPVALAAGTKYYWQVLAKGPGGTTSGSIWTFTTAAQGPAVPSGPVPSNGATGVSMTTRLSWAASTNATPYDVAFGATNPPAVVASNQTSTTYQPGALVAGTTYYWQVVAKGAVDLQAVRSGSLTTAGPRPRCRSLRMASTRSTGRPPAMRPATVARAR